ncbi:hypothetical protein ACJIZ3_001336 [Penstemon smallii]|uniref:HTH myb-type domain-containing protein n=1 Tax=Penstemon smallii TaxID=265156 RepID=A0ABD3U6W6_9LAMI
MEPLISPGLSLDCTISSKFFVPKTIGDFFAEVSRIQSASAKVCRLNDYVNKLQNEFKKIKVFERELPISMLILNDAIWIVKEELARCKKSNVEPVLEEFIPLKNSTSDERDNKIESDKEKDNMINNPDKMNWMKSVQLWNADNQHHNPNTIFKPTLKLDTINNNKRTEGEINRPKIDTLSPSVVGRAFVPFKLPVGKEERNEFPEGPGLTLEIKNSIDSSGFISKSSTSRSGSSYATKDQSNFKQSARKLRRCWSPELHHRFIDALERLGGVQAATPKQIRELMHVDGLTNDEVKSHLQKYRLHTRRIATNTYSNKPVLPGVLMSQELYVDVDSSKQSNPHSASPQGPLQLVESPTGGESIEDEDD